MERNAIKTTPRVVAEVKIKCVKLKAVSTVLLAK